MRLLKSVSMPRELTQKEWDDFKKSKFVKNLLKVQDHNRRLRGPEKCEFCNEEFERKETDSWGHYIYHHQTWICR